MKRKKLWAAVFGLLGLALAGIALWLCFTSLDAPARVLGVDDRAAERTEAWMDAVCAGDYAAAGAMMYVVIKELLPEGQGKDNNRFDILWFGAGFVLMMAMDVMLG